MEPKKNPKYDVHTKRSVIFNFSLVLSLLVVITAFNWSEPIPGDSFDPGPKPLDTDLPYVAITDFNSTSEPPKPNVTIKPRVPITPVFIPVKDLPDVDNSEQPQLDRLDNPFAGTTIEPEVLPDTTTFIFVEDQPEPVGGMQEFYKTLNKNMKYPKRAIQRGTEGKVLIEFTVDRTGELTKMKVLQGIGQGCDEEALRVISLTKWKAGKQRGKPVKVKMILPVYFTLKN